MMLAKCIDDSTSKRTCNKNERTNILLLEPHVQLTSLPDEDQRCGVRNVVSVWIASIIHVQYIQTVTIRLWSLTNQHTGSRIVC